jgi:glycosyltransferase involved in cell wall biosynthesis
MRAIVKEPRVSVAIVNWNYQAYVAEAIGSVKQQTYQNFHCVILDNGSDDASAEVIAAAIEGHPQFSFRRSPRNLGLLGGALHLLEHLEGDFVTFLDADDILAPEYLATHLQVHLAAENPVGFTSSTSTDIGADGSLLSGGSWWMSENWHACAPGLRPIDRAARLAAVDDAAYLRIAAATRYLTCWTKNWRWCPGSSNMFRRDLLLRVRPVLDSPIFLGGVDGYFTPILHAISGTQLIDLPLSAYRLHGANTYAAMPRMRNVNTGRAVKNGEVNATFLLSVASLVENVENLLTTVSPSHFWQMLDVVASMGANVPVLVHPRLKAAFISRFGVLNEAFGSDVLINELRQRMHLHDCAEIVWAARRDLMPQLVALELRRLARKLRRKSVRR